MTDLRERYILRVLHSAGPSNRWDLHEITGHSPDRVNKIAEALIWQSLVRECAAEAGGVGRPRLPLEIDPACRHLIGLALSSGGFNMCRMGLTGDEQERLDTPYGLEPARLVPAAAKVLGAAVNARTLGVGVSATGFIDPARRTLILSSAVLGAKPIDLRTLDRAARRPVVLGNDMHALATRWAMTHRHGVPENVLLVWFNDGRLGSAFLTAGRPYRGCLTGANELGHTRVDVATKLCFCGQRGCLERIASNAFLNAQSPRRKRVILSKSVDAFSTGDRALATMLRYLSLALSKAINLLRPHRLVLVSPLTGEGRFCHMLADVLLSPLRDVVRIEFWDRPTVKAAGNAA